MIHCTDLLVLPLGTSLPRGLSLLAGYSFPILDSYTSESGHQIICVRSQLIGIFEDGNRKICG